MTTFLFKNIATYRKTNLKQDIYGTGGNGASDRSGV
jgi:hypothetical protein